MSEYHHFNLAGVYLGTTDADPDPRNPDEFMPPPFGATTLPPPPHGPNQAAKLVDAAWVIVPDFRGRKYWTPDRIEHVIYDVGVEPPADALDADPGPTAAELWAAHQAQAQAALDASDMVALRCFKAGVAFPAEWLTYVNAMRAVVRAPTGDPTQPLPTRPAYPAGT